MRIDMFFKFLLNTLNSASLRLRLNDVCKIDVVWCPEPAVYGYLLLDINDESNKSYLVVRYSNFLLPRAPDISLDISLDISRLVK